MIAGRLWFASVVLTLSFAASAAARAAGDTGPAAAPGAREDDGEPSVEVLTPTGPEPPVPTAPIAPPPPPAAAPVPVAPFGFAGQFTISDDQQIGATEISYDTQGQASRTTFQLRPALDVFPVAKLSLGVQAVIGYVKVGGMGDSAARSELGLLGRVGYSFEIGPTTSVWLRVAVGYDRPGAQTPVVPGIALRNVSVQVYLPIVYRPVPRFFIAGGPILSRQISATQNGVDVPKSTTVGLQTTIGTCFRAM